MATTAEDLIVNIKAKLDQAKRDTAAYQKQLNTLEEGATVPVTVKGGRDLDELFAKVSRLGREDASIVVGIEMARAQRDIKDLLYDISRLDSEDATIEVKLQALEQARGDLDAMTAKVKELNDLPLEPGRGGNPRAGLDKIIDGAGQAQSSVANMVGNSAQDLGELSGVSGSAGVAIGQLAEYFTDSAFAARDAGQGIGAITSSFAKAAAPIAAITVAVSALGSIFSASADRAAASAARIAQSTAALGEAGSDALGLTEQLTKATDELRRMDLDARTPLGGFVEGVAGAVKSIPLLGAAVGDAGQNITDVVGLLGKAGVTMYDLAASATGNVDAWASFTAELLAAREAGAITADEYERLQQVSDLYFKSMGQARKEQALFNVTQEQANDIMQASVDPLTRYASTWRTLTEDMADGSIDTQAATDAINELATKLGLSREEVIKLAQQHLDQRMEDAAAATEEAAEAADALAIKLADANGALAELAGTFSQIGVRSDALSALFDLGNAPLDAAASVRDITIAIDELSEKAKGVTGDGIRLGAVDADELLDSIDSLRPQVQAKVVEAFSAGGPEAATAMANSYIDRVTAELGGKLTREEVAALLGLSDIEATVQVALAMSDIENAKRQLAILTGMQGQTPYTASIALALDAGTITGAQAQTLVQAQLAGAGVTVPAELAAPTTSAAVAEAQAALNAGNPVEVPTAADLGGAEHDVQGFARGAQPEATVPIAGDASDAEDERAAFVDATGRTKPVINVSASITQALITMAIINMIAQAMAPKVVVTSDISDVMGDLRTVASQRPRVPVEAYLADYPTAGEIAARIGRPRIPVDIVVGSSIRITGVRE